MRSGVLPALALCSILCGSATAEVLVRDSAATVHYQTFDPAKPPANMPRLTPPEAAVTVCGFGFSAEPHYNVISRGRGADGNWTATIGVTGVAVYVRLNLVVWLPKDASPKLKAHEEGHRKLDEMIYKKLADQAAHAAGAQMNGNTFTGAGPTAAKAEADAVRKMFQQVGNDYLAHTAAINEQINLLYDEITRHGTDPISEADAMKQAIDQYDRQHPAASSHD